MADSTAPVNPNAGIGTAEPLADNVASYREWENQARAAGYNDADITNAAGEYVGAARKAGYSEAEIQDVMGINDPTRLHEAMKARALPRLGEWTAPPATTAGESFTAGIEGSSGGLRYRGQLPDFAMPENMGFGGQMAYQAGTLLGSLADAATGGAMGAGAGILAGAPSGPGAVVPAVGGALIGGFALPAMERESYMQALIKGEVKDWSDFASRQSSVAWEGIKAATIAKFTGSAGRAAEQIGGAAFVSTARKLAAEAAAMTATSSALEGQIPTWTDLGVASTTMIGMHVALSPVALAGRGRAVMANLADHWIKTGEDPVAASNRAQNDQGLYQQLMVPKPAEPPPMSGETVFDKDTFVVGKDAPDSNEFAHWGVNEDMPHEAVFGEFANPFVKPVDPFEGQVFTTKDDPQHLFDPPPSKPTDFEKGQTYYDFGNYLNPQRWSESKQAWVNTYALSTEDWKFQRTLHEPAIGSTGEGKMNPLTGKPTMSGAITSWWHGSSSLQPALNPSFAGSIKAVWMASDKAVAHDFAAGGNHVGSGTITRIYVLPGKYFDFRDEEQQAHAEAWFNENEPSEHMGWADHMIGLLRKGNGHYNNMENPGIQRYLKENGYDGYFEREHHEQKSSVNLAVYNPEKIVRGETSVLNSQLIKINKFEQHSPAEPEDMERPGTLLAAYVHGERPADGTIHPLGQPRPENAGPAGGGNGEPPEPPQPALPPTGPEAWRLTAAELGSAVQPGWYARFVTTMRDAYRQFMNDSHPIMQMVDKAIRSGVPVPDANNPLFLNRLASGATADTIATNRIVNEFLPIIKPFMKETGPENFWTYTVARTRYFDSFADRPNPPTTAQVERWKQVMDLGNSKYADAFDKVRDFYNSTLDQLVGGRYTQEQVDAMKALGDAGLPLSRVEEEGSPEHAAVSRLGGGAANTVFSREGSDLKVLEQGRTIIARTLARTRMAMLDARNLATAKLGEQLGDAVRISQGIADWTPDEMERLGLDLRGLTGPEEGDSSKIIAAKLGWQLKGDDVITFENGMATQWRFQDPGIARLINGLDRPSVSVLQRVMIGVTNFSRNMMTTANPLFAPKIMTAYDALFQHLVNPEARNTIMVALDGVRTLFNTEDYQRAIQSGAIEHVFHSLAEDKYVGQVLQGRADPAYTMSVWNTLTRPIDALRAWSSAWFHVMPLGRFAQGTQEGETLTRAAAQATNYTFDPSAGGGPYARMINLTTQPFFKAYLTSLERNSRAILGIGRDLGGSKFSAAEFVAKAVPLVTVPFISTYLHSRDKQWYINAPDWQKNNGLLFRTGGDEEGQGTTHYFAYPPIIGLVFGGIPRMMMEAVGRGNAHAFDSVGSDIAGALAPPMGAMTYSALLPVIEKLANHSFARNTPLNPDTNVMPQEKFTPYSTWAAKKLSASLQALPILRAGNLTPIEIDNFVQGWTGSAGRFLVRAAEQAASYAGVIQSKLPADSFWDWPGLASFHSREIGAGAQPIRDFEDRMKSNAAVAGSMSVALAQGDPDRFRELTGSDPAAALLHKVGERQVSPGATPMDFIDSLDAAVQAMNGKVDPLTNVLRADQLMKLDRQAVGYIANLPNNTTLSDTQKAGLMSYQRALASVHPGVNPIDLATISPLDKKQLLDRIYARMSLAAQSGLANMDKAGMR